MIGTWYLASDLPVEFFTPFLSHLVFEVEKLNLLLKETSFDFIAAITTRSVIGRCWVCGRGSSMQQQ